MKRTYNNLDEMLDLVRENRPARSLFSTDDLQGMIEKGHTDASAPAAGEANSPTSLIQTTHTKSLIVMISIASLILTGALLLHFGNSGNPFADNPAHHVAGTQQTMQRKESVAHAAKPGRIQESIGTAPLSGKKPGRGGDQIPQKEEKQKDQLKDGQKSEISPAGAVISGLTAEELNLIFDIRFPEGTTEIPSERMARKDALNSKVLQAFAKRGYDTTAPWFTVRSNAVIVLEPGSVSGSTNIAPPSPNALTASPVAVALWNNEQGGLSLSMDIGSNEQLERVGMLEEELGEEIHGLSEKQGIIASESLLNRLIALRITRPFIDSKGKETTIDIYVWYVPTPELVQALPERYRTPDLTSLAAANYPKPNPAAGKKAPLIPGVMRFTTISSDGDDPKPNYSKELQQFDGNSDISGIQFVDLTRDELQRIGVQHTDSGLNFVMQQEFMVKDPNTAATLERLGYPMNGSTTNVGFLVTADTFKMDYKEMSVRDFTPSPLSPVLYSCRWAKSDQSEGLYMIFNTESPLLKKLAAEKEKADQADPFSEDLERNPEYSYLNKLIPVRISMEGKESFAKTGKRYGSDIILWYVPTPEFVNALPDRYRIQLEKELRIIASVEESNLPPGEVCREMAGEMALLDFCRSGSGAISYTRAWPNPATEQVTLHYVLTEPRQVAVTLHDLSGRFMEGMTGFTSQSAGQHQQRIVLDRTRIKTGTYLVTIRTDKGEQAVQRIVVD